MKNIRIGTSGWYYKHWDEVFYPKEIKSSARLPFYAESFSSVEVNATFYRLPSEETVKNWFYQVPKDFIFSIKANQFITHRKRLKDPIESTANFFKIVSLLESKLGPILFQLPPSFQLNLDRLNEFTSQLPKEFKYAFEFRHESWYCSQTYEVLKNNHCALCITDLAGKLSPIEVTAPWTYIRLHGPKKAYQGSYSSKQILEWKERIEKWHNGRVQVFCYFDNDEKGFAIQDAKTLFTYFK